MKFLEAAKAQSEAAKAQSEASQLANFVQLSPHDKAAWLDLRNSTERNRSGNI